MNTALIGLDYIVDIMHPTGKIARSAAHAAQRDVVGRFNRALAAAKQKDWLRIGVKVGFEPGYADLPAHSPMFGRAQAFGALDLSGAGTAFHPDLDAAAFQLVVVKPRVSVLCDASRSRAARASDRTRDRRGRQHGVGRAGGGSRRARSRLRSARARGRVRGRDGRRASTLDRHAARHRADRHARRSRGAVNAARARPA